jgi:hypothetical protein
MGEQRQAWASRTWSAIHGAWSSHSREVSAAIVVIVALLAVLPRLVGTVRWTPDGLFYQAQVYEIQGATERAALHREFTSQAAIGITRPDGRVGNPKWVTYSAQFYRRRWLVPLMATAIYPAAGGRSLLYVSIVGYLVAGLLLFALLRRRFSDGVSCAVALACLLLPPVRTFAGFPLTDSWGLALEIGALIAALVALERGGRWILVWTATMLALSFTRDSTAVLIVAVAWAAFVIRTRRSAVVLGTGVAASVPALALFGAPLVRQLAYVMQGFHPPTVVSWSYVIDHYPASLWSLLRQDAHYPMTLTYPAVWYAIGAALVAALGYMFIAGPRRDPFFMLTTAAFVGAAALVAISVNYTDMRLELVFVPSLAVALAFAASRLLMPGRAWLARYARTGSAVLEPDGPC